MKILKNPLVILKKPENWKNLGKFSKNRYKFENPVNILKKLIEKAFGGKKTEKKSPSLCQPWPVFPVFSLLFYIA